jgi:hypothetical protein
VRRFNERGRKYYAANREKNVQRNRKWYAANPEKDLRKNRKYNAANRQQAAADQFFVMAGAAQQISEAIGKPNQKTK